MLKKFNSVCFVCGSQGADHNLHSKSNDNGPYFPFLQHHEPPRGSLIPGPDGVIRACNVCYFFLMQQWDSFEATKTNHLKRLYWLKRADNRQFTGAEPNLQGEYVAQLMGLPYNGNGYNCIEESGEQSSSRVEDGAYSSTWKPSTPVPDKNKKSDFSVNESGALDLSVHRDPRSTEPKQKERSEGKVAVSEIKVEQVHNTFICFTCGETKPTDLSRTVSSKPQTNDSPFFPSLEMTTPCKGALPLNDQGCAVVCTTCHMVLYQQWTVYHQSMAYQKPTPSLSLDKGSERQGKKQLISNVICYICGQSQPSESMKKIHTKSSSVPGTMCLPFLAGLEPASGAKPLDSKDRAHTCRKCYKNLKSQWKRFAEDDVAGSEQTYTLTNRSPVSARTSARHEDKKTSINPLSVDVSPDHSRPAGGASKSVGLLAIAAMQPHQAHHPSLTTMIGGLPASRMSSRRTSSASESNEPQGCSAVNVVRHSVGETNCTNICFLCGVKCHIGQAIVLSSFPNKSGVGDGISPFFPFLSNHSKAAGSEAISEEGTVIVCVLCSLNLVTQWNDYELSTDLKDRNRWLRNYHHNDIICFICSVRFSRKRARVILIEKFPFLESHPRPPKSLVVDQGSSVVICTDCHGQLSTQNEEYEKMGLPIGMRKYNWVVHARLPSDGVGETSAASIQQEEEEERAEEARKQSELAHGISQATKAWVESDGSRRTAISPKDTGLPPGSKPPPLTMMNPASSKIQRTTATVPPLNQVSPNNAAMSATRNSSFAAALRKLAKQAGEGDGSSHDSSEAGSSATSPRSVTPKRGPPPPLIYNSTNSSISSPPVVTIAPTPSHLSLAARTAMERPHLGTATTESSRHDYRTSILGHRDEERLSTSESSLSSRRLTPHSSLGMHGSSLNREELMHGFQPYRPSEDYRGGFPPPMHLDPSAAAAAAASAGAGFPYSAYMSHQLAAHGAFRLDDPLLMERYRMMGLQMPYLQFAHPGLMPPGGYHPMMAGMRYPPELMQQHMAMMSPNFRSPLMEAERQRLEEEHRRKEREKEEEKDRERKLELEREKEKERQREIEKQKEAEKERLAREDALREAEKLRAMSRLSHGLVNKYENDARMCREREEKHKEMLQEQIAREHGIFARERERRLELERRERSLDNQYHGTQSQMAQVSPQQRQDMPKTTHKFYRPFEKDIPNGFDMNSHHAIDYDRKLLNERLMTEGRSLLLHNGPAPKDRLDSDKHEGIQARLLENEATRKHSSPVLPYNQYDYDRKPPLYNYYPLPLNKGSSRLHDQDSKYDSLDSESQGVSKLDVEEKWRKQSRLNGACDSENADDDFIAWEEKRTQKLLSVFSVPTAEADYSKDKLNFLGNFGVVTPCKANGMLLKQLIKRHKIYRERCASPEQPQEEPITDEISNLCNSNHLPRIPEDKQRTKFLRQLGLKSASSEDRRRVKHLRHVCEDESKRRMSIPAKDRCCNAHLYNDVKPEAVKRKHEDTTKSDEVPKKRSSPDTPLSTSSSRITLGQLAAQRGNSKTGQTNRAVIFPEARDKQQSQISREFAQEFHQSVLQTTRQQQQEMATKSSIEKRPEESLLSRPSESHSKTSSHDSQSATHSPRGRTFSQSNPSKDSEPSSSKSSLPHHHPMMHPFHNLPRTSSDQSGSSSQASPLPARYDNSAVFKWPGIEVLMEAYQRTVEGSWQPRMPYPYPMMPELHRQLPDANLLRNSENHRLLTQHAQNLSLRMADLMQNKQQMEASHDQSAIDSLKQCFKHLR